jgi:tetratricopeptide (TPR) repeat protein
LVLLAAILIGTIACRKKYPFLLVGWLWYLGMLVPMIGFLQISYYAHADRYTYLSQIGLALAVTWAVAEWSLRWKNRRAILGGFMATALGALIVCGHAQTAYWKDSETLWKRALACTSGNSLASYNLANALHDLGRLDEAVGFYQGALQMDPLYFQAECNLGNTRLEQGQTDQAIACFQRTLEMQPGYAKAYCNLGNALMKQGHTDQAVFLFEKAIAIQPDYSKVEYNLANALFDLGRLDEAVGHYRKALERESDNTEARFNLGNTFLNLGRSEEAIGQYRAVLQLKPEYAGALNNLGAALMQAGHIAEAVDEYRKALETQPENVDALNNLAWVLATCPLASLRDGAKAVALAHKAVQLSAGNNPLTWRTLAAAEAEVGHYAEAVEAAQQALQLTGRQNNDALASALQRELELYRTGTPMREVKP